MDYKNCPPETVVNLYDITNITPLVGIEDYTDGIYYGNPSLDHKTAQRRNQHNYILDELKAREGFKLLDVGCGLGTLLETARERGVKGIGITISEGQVKRCREKGLEVYLMDYRDIPYEWNNQFDGIVANGSLEHFCQPQDAIQGKQDQIYREMFEIFHRLISDSLDSGRVVTTAIHFREKAIPPKKLLKHPFLQIFDKEGFHAAVLNRGYGGYYPVPGQLEQCAKGLFRLVREVDGTQDYLYTSEFWCKEYKKALFTNQKVFFKFFRYFLKRPAHSFWAISSYVGFESWPWQFRGENPRTILFRHTWEKQKIKNN